MSDNPAQPPVSPLAASQPVPAPPLVTSGLGAARQLAEMPREEIRHLAQQYGLDPDAYRSRQQLIAAIYERRQLIGSLDREAMLDVVKWARLPVPLNATSEQLAIEIIRLTCMRFAGLTHAGLVALARLRGVQASLTDPIARIVQRLRRQEGFFTRLNRKRRAVIGSWISNMIGDGEGGDYQFLPPQETQQAPTAAAAPGRPTTIKDEIEDAGIIGGIAGRIKRSADAYLNQKLDEIEARIDRKLDEIDRRLAEWRDKEIANRIRILKITLWASVIVAALSLVYSYIKVNFPSFLHLLRLSS